MKPKKYYDKEPQGIERHNEIKNIKNKGMGTNDKDMAEYMGRCFELYVANACDIDKLKTRIYGDSNEDQDQARKAALGGMEADNAILWNMMQEAYDVGSKVSTPPVWLSASLWDISNIDDIVAEEIAKRKPKNTILVTNLSVESLLELASKAVNQASKMLKPKEEVEPYRTALSYFVSLIEEGSTRDLMDHANNVKEKFFSE